MTRYDIAIIGTGPAGLEAAITAKVRNKNILLLGGKLLSDKVNKAHTIQNYLGLPEVSGEEMQKAFQRHLEQMQVIKRCMRQTRLSLPAECPLPNHFRENWKIWEEV